MRDVRVVGNVNAPGAGDVLDGRGEFPGPDVLDALNVLGVPNGFDVVDVSKGSGLR
ncbi:MULTISPECIES: hypothetical protein [unclassified Streptomyces]|uniref:hypothetical protein n=1 Tax=unclassified Streptomyces TaxID=2593676 RepID=UPI001587650E|nr:MULTISPECIES: hypothetical protein [unclassified Streptomyces]NUV65799.1 hypothetical protein [Streptomyces sp. CAI-121]NUW01123.1 hypothetical protein [Streptomyces sp. CAI 127]NUW12536.1 hypothetical protein [Streptomyces sp. CAI-68]